MRLRMSGYVIQDAFEDGALHSTQFVLGRLDQSKSAGAFSAPTEVIVGLLN